MATKLAEKIHEQDCNNYLWTFDIFSKNCVSSLSMTSTNLEGISVFFVFPFYNVNFLKFFGRVKNNKRLKAPRAPAIENRAKILKADWFKNDITHVLIKMVSPLGRVGI